ncbi:class I SAM-dependent methyltransferase [Streptomyces cupreus]|uniref:Class I SAM-dependent methyltransferase n=1 Tax=Streptomyces cupreus TaxID=2759956 RepID=A0A7X1JAD5_9ACTN|nr:class I SAM-dependent methyltransferase [Streptomyces cupreus]MBC2906107.1 class I SAM-dependent methyltransferase [Streptomyces cupreus]
MRTAPINPPLACTEERTVLDCQTEISQGRRFAFGLNWQKFGRLIDEERVRGAQTSLENALGTSDLTGRTFLDVGCGSGLFSLAALRLGARVRSFDFDPDSVATTRKLRDDFAPGSAWDIECASILDAGFVQGLGQFDIVYSWGVLHHTGALWKAMEAVCGLVARDGLLYVSIYNDQGGESRMWTSVKRRYNDSGPAVRRLLLAGSMLYLGRRYPLRVAAGLMGGGAGSTPWTEPCPRGMSRKHDLVDWVGGYPFEVASPERVFDFCREREFQLRHLKTCKGGIGCNEFIFARS